MLGVLGCTGQKAQANRADHRSIEHLNTNNAVAVFVHSIVV